MILRPYPRRTQVPIGAALIGAGSRTSQIESIEAYEAFAARQPAIPPT